MVTYVKLVAGRHVAASLQETLAASWRDSTYADLTVNIFPSSDQAQQSHASLRANTSVVAAASPVLKSVLREASSSGDGGPTLVITGYHASAVSSFFHFIYQGHTVLASEIVDEFKQLLKDFGVDTESNVSTSGAITAVVRKHRVPMVRDVPQRGTLLSSNGYLEVDPVVRSLRYESMCNPDYSLRQSSFLEKSAIKYQLLPPHAADPSRASQFDWLVRRASPDHIGIYWDSSLQMYYENMVRSLPPFRIFLRIDSEPYDDINTGDTSRTKPAFTYRKQPESRFVMRKTIGSLRLPALSICRVSGKFHVVLGSPLDVNSSVRGASSPVTQDNDSDACQPYEEQFSEVLDEEMRRKRVLHSTLSRLKREYFNAKRVAREILRSCRDAPYQPSDANEIRSSTDPVSVVKSTTRKKLKTVCEVCGKAVTSSWLQAHMANHRGSKPYLCEHCGRCFATNNLLRSHCYYQHNSNLRRFVCNVCSKAFPKKSRLETHMRIHNDERPFSCDVCSKRFHTSSNLQKHSQIHVDAKPFQCQDCGKSFTHKSSLNIHEKRHLATTDGAAKKTYDCNICSLVFSRPKRYLAHVRSHGGFDVRLSCTLCHAEFISIDELTRHKTKEHPGKSYSCELCGKVFHTRTALGKHTELHTTKKEAKKSFTCTFCGAQFTCEASRRDHERQHTGEKPFSCGKCGKGFASRHNFSQHLRVHSEERPYLCQLCGSSFKQRQHLNAHSLIHDPSTEPLKCADCGKYYRNKLLLVSHQRIHKQKADVNDFK